ncbi:MAG: hypothetical protein EA349_09685 [Halomonadaceae bacterium]|nr:MAG: hypothetical protein EA349_09685 [Halomonadaceae bacterium]
MYKLLPISLFALVCLASQGTLAQSAYRCDGPDGVEFRDSPCDDSSVPLDLRTPPPGGQLRQPLQAAPVTPEPEEPAEETTQESSPSPCRDFTSTEARRLRIGEQVEAGMSREQVEASWGRPVERFEAGNEIWIYDNRYYGQVVNVRRVIFQDGCVLGVEVRKP